MNSRLPFVAIIMIVLAAGLGVWSARRSTITPQGCNSEITSPANMIEPSGVPLPPQGCNADATSTSNLIYGSTMSSSPLGCNESQADSSNLDDPAVTPTTPQGCKAEREPLTITFVGDMMFDRSVWSKMSAQGLGYPFARIGDLLAGGDFLIGNLEGPITDRGSHAVPNGALLFKFEPAVAQLLADQGFDWLSLANNHTHNQGSQGLADSQTHLEAAGVGWFGHPRAVSHDDVALIEQNGWKLALVGWNTIEVMDTHEAELLALIGELDAEVDLVIVLPHWGNEYRPQTDEQIASAHALIEAGADLIVGAHAHTVQGIEIYQNRPIIYSLGNFIFDQYWSEPTQQGLVAQVILREDGIDLEFRPVDLRASQPRLADESIVSTIFDRLLEASQLEGELEQRLGTDHKLILNSDLPASAGPRPGGG